MAALPVEVTVNASPVDVPISTLRPIVCRFVGGPATTGTCAITVAAPGSTIFETLENNTLDLTAPVGIALEYGDVGTLRLTPAGLDGDAVVRVAESSSAAQVG